MRAADFFFFRAADFGNGCYLQIPDALWEPRVLGGDLFPHDLGRIGAECRQGSPGADRLIVGKPGTQERGVT